MSADPAATNTTTPLGHEIAFGILSAGLGEPLAWELWNGWTLDQRAAVAAFADEHFAPQLRSLADELVTWERERGPGYQADSVVSRVSAYTETRT